MKNVKLMKRESSERLVKLVDTIPELVINKEYVMYNDNIMYNAVDGDFCWRINNSDIKNNPLNNAYKLQNVLGDGVESITEESFCDLLEEHLYLTAKEKMEELLPQIQEYYPKASIHVDRYGLFITEHVNKKAIVKCPVTTLYQTFRHNSKYSHIWENREKLIVKKPKPWWEIQGAHYIMELKLNDMQFTTAKCLWKMNPTDCNTVGITRFKNKQEAQAMCDKLNKVLKGE